MGSHGLITYVPGLVGFGVDLRGENNNLRSAAHGWNPTFNEQTVVVFLVSYVCFFCFFFTDSYLHLLVGILSLKLNNNTGNTGTNKTTL